MTTATAGAEHPARPNEAPPRRVRPRIVVAISMVFVVGLIGVVLFSVWLGYRNHNEAPAVADDVRSAVADSGLRADTFVAARRAEFTNPDLPGGSLSMFPSVDGVALAMTGPDASGTGVDFVYIGDSRASGYCFVGHLDAAGAVSVETETTGSGRC